MGLLKTHIFWLIDGQIGNNSGSIYIVRVFFF